LRPLIPALDPAFLGLLRARDPKTLAAIVQQHGRALYRTARGLGFDAPASEDLVQEVFLTFLSTLDRFEGRSQIGTWLFGILCRKVRERRRAFERERRFDPIDEKFASRFTPSGHWKHPLEDLERMLDSSEIGRAVEECLSGLPLQQREAFLLREVEELATDEICKILEITVTHMGVLLHRARHRLRECLKEKGR
jgi:RNA polymerase sigma-70 factor (ECF subfamily)